jgi:hypothetical protein
MITKVLLQSVRIACSNSDVLSNEPFKVFQSIFRNIRWVWFSPLSVFKFKVIKLVSGLWIRRVPDSWTHCFAPKTHFYLQLAKKMSPGLAVWTQHSGTLKPHCIQSSRVLVPAGTSKSTSRHPGRNQGHGERCWCSDAVTLSSTMRTGGFELGSSALTSSTLKWLHRIQCGFKSLNFRANFYFFRYWILWGGGKLLC